MGKMNGSADACMITVFTGDLTKQSGCQEPESFPAEILIQGQELCITAFKSFGQSIFEQLAMAWLGW